MRMVRSELIQLMKGHPLKLSCLALLIISPPVLRMIHYFTPLLASTALCVLALITIGQNRNPKAASETDLDDENASAAAVDLLSNSIDTSLWSTEITKEDREEVKEEEGEEEEGGEVVVMEEEEEEVLKASPRRSSERATIEPAKEMKDDDIGNMNGNDDMTCDGDKMNVTKAMNNVEGLSTSSTSSEILSFCVEQDESADNASSVKELLQEGIHNSNPRESHGCLRDYPREEATMPLTQRA